MNVADPSQSSSPHMFCEIGVSTESGVCLRSSKIEEKEEVGKRGGGRKGGQKVYLKKGSTTENKTLSFIIHILLDMPGKLIFFKTVIAII